MEKLAEAILLAAKIREESYDHDAADKAKKKLQSRRDIITDSRAFIDYSKFYTLALYKACDKAAGEVGFDERGTLPLYLMLKYSWNDILGWAEEIMKKKRFKKCKNCISVRKIKYGKNCEQEDNELEYGTCNNSESVFFCLCVAPDFTCKHFEKGINKR